MTFFQWQDFKCSLKFISKKRNYIFHQIANKDSKTTLRQIGFGAYTSRSFIITKWEGDFSVYLSSVFHLLNFNMKVRPFMQKRTRMHADMDTEKKKKKKTLHRYDLKKTLDDLSMH